ncbi:hypothetical protein Pmani_023304 [Petrolisthes manimaculis]|uniref:Uncharacterized protein n=1 Tax=Petrolisthes manimaculis TaxID=1843537 RepID=A0AAE1PAZ2_9EUCA|nr:hypothetical protein Pmani_023304 [Petrolisthes manimaculis]
MVNLVRGLFSRVVDKANGTIVLREAEATTGGGDESTHITIHIEEKHLTLLEKDGNVYSSVLTFDCDEIGHNIEGFKLELLCASYNGGCPEIRQCVPISGQPPL